MIGVALFRGVFLGGIMLWYTLGVWKTVDQYFRDQFQVYLTKELEENEAMKKDILEDKAKLAERKSFMLRLAKLEFSQNLDKHISPGDRRGGEDVRTTQDKAEGEYTAEEFIEEEEEECPAEEFYEESVQLPEEAEGIGVYEERGEEHDSDTIEENTQHVNYAAMETVDDEGTFCDPEGEECEDYQSIDHGDEGVGKWRNVFDEEDEMCRFEDAKSSCALADESDEESHEIH